MSTPPPPSLVTITTIPISPIPNSSPPSSLPRSVFTGVTTTTVMLHRDYFDAVQFHGSKVDVEDGLVRASQGIKGPWMEDSPELKPCWSISPSDEAVSSKGYVTFYLTNGPEYHISQITDAVMVAKHLGATFVLPDIRGSKPGDERTLKISSSLELQPGNAEKRLCEAEGACQDSVNLALAAKVDLAKVQAEVERLHVKICSIEIARKFLEDKSKVEIVRRTCHVDFLGFMGRLEVKKSPLIARVESMEEIFLDDQDLDTSSDEAFVSPGCVADSIVGSDGTFIFFTRLCMGYAFLYGFLMRFNWAALLRGLRKSWVLRNASLTARDFPMCELIDPLSDLPELDPRFHMRGVSLLLLCASEGGEVALWIGGSTGWSKFHVSLFWDRSSGRFSPANSNWREERLSALKRARQFLLLGCFPYYLILDLSPHRAPNVEE
ncbi:hypothetical protein Bca52824_017597 [Brassica carinata]|uniref:O-fucosyltransferase family protein n=1 Tax=Brassica carinata TaxID=52824 RepID=A0A8X7VPD9_BRACI|nr:hypothetical protein Bca52824_017597 [Brassica carinata]